MARERRDEPWKAPTRATHGQRWRKLRNETDILKHTPLNLMKKWPAFIIWECGLFVFAAAAAAVFVLALAAPDLFVTPV